MARSTAQKKAAKKARGGKTYSRGLGRDRARAPHHLPGPKERGVPRMLIRNHVNELLRIEIEDWRRIGESEFFKATAIFRDGQRRERASRLDYEPGEREELMMAGFTRGHRRLLRKFDAIRRYRSGEKQRILGELQRQYGKGLPG